MVKLYLKRLKKMPLHFQIKFLEVIKHIESGNLETLDISKLQNAENTFRCRVGKFRIIFYKNTDGKYIIDQIGSRGDIYK